MSGGTGAVVVFATAATFDNFNRVIIDDGISGWGTPSSVTEATGDYYPVPDTEHFWSTAASDAGVASVNGSAGVAVASSILFLSAIYQDLTNTELPWAEAFTLSMDWSFDTDIPANEYITLFVGVFSNDSADVQQLVLYLSNIGGDPSIIQVTGDGLTDAVIDLPPANTAIHLKWDFTPNGEQRAKVWWTGGEPDWMVTRTDVDPTGENKRLVISNDQSFAHIQYLDFIEFGGGTPVVISGR